MAADNWAVADSNPAGYWVVTDSPLTETNVATNVPYRTKFDCTVIKNNLNALPGNAGRFSVGSHPHPH